MIDFEEELKKFRPSLEVEEAEEAINGQDLNLYHKEWVVYCKPPFKSVGKVIEYLGRYTHRIAISNSRLLQVQDSKVSFSWRDYRDHSRKKGFRNDRSFPRNLRDSTFAGRKNFFLEVLHFPLPVRPPPVTMQSFFFQQKYCPVSSAENFCHF